MTTWLFNVINRKIVNQVQNIPGPKPIFPLGNILDLLTVTAFERMQKYGEEYGDITLFWILSQPNILVNSPELFEEILSTNRDAYYKNSPTNQTKPVLRSDMFIANGDDWARKRPTHPFIKPDANLRFNQLLPAIRELINQNYQQFSAQGTIEDFYDRLWDLYFYVFGKAVLDSEMSPELLQDFKRIMNELSRRMQGLNFSPDPRFWRKLEHWFNSFESLIKQRQQEDNSNRADNLSYGLTNKTGLTIDELQDQLSAGFVAGVNPVATTIISATYLLQQHPEVKQKLAYEIGDFWQQNPDGYDTTSIEQLNYLDRVVNETLRLYSTVPLLLRQVCPGAGVNLKGHHIPEETPIWISSWALQRNGKYWPNPDTFNPDRFVAQPVPFSFLPFGAGPRSCVGESFARLCIKVTLIEILTKYEVKMDSDYQYQLQTDAGFSKPKNKVKVTVKSI
ncbi:MAG TPA: hypothetical protein DCF68_01405 [Cyanothece sp. UBA12306]|nr:hypothetical protein [Cyanothece sp. UBA12306]